jgi:hypothetical protein
MCAPLALVQYGLSSMVVNSIILTYCNTQQDAHCEDIMCWLFSQVGQFQVEPLVDNMHYTVF